MKKYKILIPIVLISLIFSACEKEITIDLPEVESKLVVEGTIEQNQYAKVILTKSSPYFAPIDSAALFNSIVNDATVTLKHGAESEVLTPVIDLNTFPYFMYKGNVIKGIIGERYDLSIDWQGKTYTASTTIPKPIHFDTLWFKLKENNDTIGNIFAVGSEPGDEYNYYREFTKIKGVDLDFVPIFGSVWDDKFFNGQTFTAQLYHGFASNIVSPDDDNPRGLGYKIGDTVISKLCTMDYESYLFWKAAESEIYATGNPFATTTSVPTNITGGALGVWTGFGAGYDTIICK